MFWRKISSVGFRVTDAKMTNSTTYPHEGTAAVLLLTDQDDWKPIDTSDNKYLLNETNGTCRFETLLDDFWSSPRSVTGTNSEW